MRFFASVVAPAAGLLVGAAILCASPSSAQATELSTDPPTDPNGPPPPPPPMPEPGTVGSPTPPPAPGSTAAQLEQADEEDTGVGLHFVYIQPEVGIGVSGIPSALTLGKDTGTPVGPLVGIGAGAELITFQVGGRLRTLITPHYNLWTIGGEFNYQPGSGRFWPRIGVAVGYAWANGWNSDICGTQCGLLDVSGIDVGLRAGLQYFVTSSVEIGADAGLDALFLKRKGIGGSPQFSSDESGTGFMAVATVHLGLHF
jgi:hypothetical protein